MTLLWSVAWKPTEGFFGPVICDTLRSLSVLREPERLALALGPAHLIERLRRLLGLRSVEVRETDEDQEILEALSGASATLVIVEHSRLAGLDPNALEQANPPDGKVPLIAFGCPDGAASDAALAEGATLAVRTDATDVEVGGLLDICLAERALAAELHLAHEDLRRHAALVMKDDLTAAYNRRFFERCLDDELDRARRFETPLSLIFMDIDNLREVNQGYGHAMGSTVLREAAARTIRTVRSIDKAVRYGGDEFCVVLPETDWRGALEVADRIRHAFSGRPFAVDGGSGIPLTASFGVASYPVHGTTKAELIKAADQAMFQVKEREKNAIQVANEDIIVRGTEEVTAESLAAREAAKSDDGEGASS